MKKSLMAFAVLGAFGSCGAAYAQSNVTMYGLIDTTISTVNNANAAGARLTGFQVPWFSGSRLGFQGKEDLGSGLKTIFKLESEYVTTTGEMDTPGVLFNRDAWVGLQSDSLGKLTFGRQNALGRDVAAEYIDTYGSDKISTKEGGGTNTNNFKQLIFYAGSTTGTRLDNGVVWKKLFSNGFFTGLAYQFGEVPGNFSRNTTETAALGYNGTNYAISGFITQANIKDQTHRSYSLGGDYVLGLVRLNAGYFHYTADQGALGQRKDDAYTVSAKLKPAGAFDYELGYQVMKANNAAYNAAGTSTLNAFADASTAATTGSGKKNTLYGSVFYHLSKRTELYLAADHMKLNNGYRVASANGFSSQTEFAAGMRTRF